MILDLGIHQGLGEGRIIAFVVAITTITEHIDHGVFGEFLTVFGRHLGGKHHRFRIVTIAMEDRGLGLKRDI